MSGSCVCFYMNGLMGLKEQIAVNVVLQSGVIDENIPLTAVKHIIFHLKERNQEKHPEGSVSVCRCERFSTERLFCRV